VTKIDLACAESFVVIYARSETQFECNGTPRGGRAGSRNFLLKRFSLVKTALFSLLNNAISE
jgi:hypothetical protein